MMRRRLFNRFQGRPIPEGWWTLSTLPQMGCTPQSQCALSNILE